MAIGLSILEQEDALKNLPTQALQGLMGQPSPQVPPFMVAAELKRREEMAKEFAGKEAATQTAQQAPTVAARLAGSQQPVPMSQAGAMATPPPQPPMPQGSQLAMAMSGVTGQPPPQLPTVNARTGTDGAAVSELVEALRGRDVGIPAQGPEYKSFASRERPPPVSPLVLARLIAALERESEPERAYAGFEIPWDTPPLKRGRFSAPARPVAMAADGTQGRTVYAQDGLRSLGPEVNAILTKIEEATERKREDFENMQRLEARAQANADAAQRTVERSQRAQAGSDILRLQDEWARRMGGADIPGVTSGGVPVAVSGLPQVDSRSNEYYPTPIYDQPEQYKEQAGLPGGSLEQIAAALRQPARRSQGFLPQYEGRGGMEEYPVGYRVPPQSAADRAAAENLQSSGFRSGREAALKKLVATLDPTGKGAAPWVSKEQAGLPQTGLSRNDIESLRMGAARRPIKNIPVVVPSAAKQGGALSANAAKMKQMLMDAGQQEPPAIAAGRPTDLFSAGIGSVAGQRAASLLEAPSNIRGVTSGRVPVAAGNQLQAESPDLGFITPASAQEWQNYFAKTDAATGPPTTAGGRTTEARPWHPISGDKLPAGAQVHSALARQYILPPALSPQGVPRLLGASNVGRMGAPTQVGGARGEGLRKDAYEEPFRQVREVPFSLDDFSVDEPGDPSSGGISSIRNLLSRAPTAVLGKDVADAQEQPRAYDDSEVALFTGISLEEFDVLSPRVQAKLHGALELHKVDTQLARGQAEVARKAALMDAESEAIGLERTWQTGPLARLRDYITKTPSELEIRDARDRELVQQAAVLREAVVKGAPRKETAKELADRVAALQAESDVDAETLRREREYVGLGSVRRDIEWPPPSSSAPTVVPLSQYPKALSQKRTVSDGDDSSVAALQARLNKISAPAAVGERKPSAQEATKDYLTTLNERSDKIFSDLKSGLKELAKADDKEFKEYETRFRALDEYHKTGKLPERMRQDRITNLMLEMSKALLGNQNLYDAFQEGVANFQTVDKAAREKYADDLAAMLTASKGMVDSKMAIRNARRQESIAMTRFAAEQNRGNATLAQGHIKIAEQARQNVRANEINLIRAEIARITAGAQILSASRTSKEERLMETLPGMIYESDLAKAKAGDRTDLDAHFSIDANGTPRIDPLFLLKAIGDAGRGGSVGAQVALAASRFDSAKRQFQKDVGARLKDLGGSWTPKKSLEWGAIATSIGLTSPRGPMEFDKIKDQLVPAAKRYYAAQIAKELQFVTPGMNDWIAQTYGRVGGAQQTDPVGVGLLPPNKKGS